MPPVISLVLKERGVCVGLLLAGVVLLVAQSLGLRLYVCPFQAATGLPCAGCGLTRGTAALLRGDFTAATQFHPFSVLVPVGLVLLLLSACLTGPVRTKYLALCEAVERKTGLGCVLLFSLIAFGIWRLQH
jgi:hypothetical protein